MSRFNAAKTSTKTTNLAGGQAYSHTPQMELIVSVLTTFLEDKAYETGDARIERIKELCKKVDHTFLAKLAIMARNEFHLRSVSHLLVGELARMHRGDDLVKRVIERVAERPDDLTELVAYLGKPIPKQVKRGIRHSLLKFSPYQLAKYKMEGKDVKLVDLFNLAHPDPKRASPAQKEAWAQLLKGELKNTDTWEARLSSGEDKSAVWKDLLENKKLGYMALLRNLRNIIEQADLPTKVLARKQLTDPEAVKSSKQLPFRFYTAFTQVSDQTFLQAIAEAFEHSISNVPTLEGETLVAIDCSDSMNSGAIEKAAVLGAALHRANGGDLILYDTEIYEIKSLSINPTMTIAQQIMQNAHGGGTDTSLVFQHAAKTGKKYSRIVILSDNESWQDSNYGVGTNAIYNEYKKTNDCFIYAMDIQGYGTKDVTGNKVFHLAGFSEKVFDFMKWMENENGLIQIVDAVEV